MGATQTNKEILILQIPLKHYNSTLIVEKSLAFDLHLRKKKNTKMNH